MSSKIGLIVRQVLPILSLHRIVELFARDVILFERDVTESVRCSICKNSFPVLYKNEQLYVVSLADHTKLLSK